MPFAAPGREHHLRPEEPHELATLDREAVRYRDHERIALRGADHRKADARVAARGLHHVWPGFSAPLRSASPMMLIASRSLTEAAGSKNSALT
jgi:hypothetical protein